jgi:sugar phosphate isomerase/epimerase
MTASAAPQVIVANGSLRSAAFPERVTAASRAGFDGFGMHVRDYAYLRSEGWTDADLRAVLRDNGFGLIEIETILGWDDPPERRDADGLRRAQLAFELADAVGARHVMAVGALTGEPRETAAEGFAGLCDRAAEHGLLVALEPQACSTIADLGAARAIVRAAGRPNGGLNLDIWHATRGGWPPAELAALSPDEIVVIQLNDGPTKPVTDDYLDECTHYRAPPGEGEFDVEGFLRVLYGTATTAPVSVEVMSDELDLLPVQTTADRLAAATRRALAAASLGPAGAERSRPTTRRG